MFDLRAEDGSVRRKEAHLPAADDVAADTRPRRGNRLDKADMVELHHMMTSYYTTELDRQYENRMQMAKDEDFYDNEQWDEADKAEVEGRGQVALVYNVVSASVDWVTGTEKRARSDYKVLPRRKPDAKPAQRKTELLKYLADVNRTPFHRSRAFSDSVKVGLGWLEDGITDEPGEEPLYSRYENWRNVLWDSAATELSLEDGRYIFRSKWVDLDVATAMFPKRKAILERSAADSDSFAWLDQYGDEAMDSIELSMEQESNSRGSDRITGFQRRRLRLIEAWIRLPARAEVLKGGSFDGELYDAQSRGHAAEIESGEATIVTRPTLRMHVAIFCSAGMLWFSQSPYRHNRFPLTPIWAYRRGRDGMPYGMIRRLRDIQDDINKRASKALYILSTNKVVLDDDTIPDGVSVEEFKEEASRPDAFLVKKKDSFLQLAAERELPQYHLELMSRSIAMVQQASGVTDELLGRRTNATSGIAIQRRQEQGTMATAIYFDNYRLALQLQGEKQLANIEQFVSEQKAFRITNIRGNAEYVVVNDGDPENDIVRSKADYVISEEDWRATVRQAAAAELLDLLGKIAPVAPQVVIVMLDLLIESMDLPNRDELVRRIRAITGMTDPDADGDEPSPEQILQEQQKAKVAAMQEADAMATIRKKEADASLSEAKAAETQARTVSANVGSQRTALDAAAQAIVLPDATYVADHIMAEAGFVSASDKAVAHQQLAAGLARQQQAQAQVQAQQEQQQPVGIQPPSQPQQ